MEAVQQYQPGQVLPGTVYRVVRHLATGGMGSVYEVEDTTVEKRYVLKTLHPQLVAREDLARRMRDEARALAKLSHPNIVEVITAGVTTDAVKMPFYVMERLNGQNLRTLLQRKRILSLTHCYRVAIDVLDALEHAHEHHIVHRDVKPENIFLHRNASGVTTTKLLDFGIVRMLDRKASHTHGKFIGTLRYASPEQVTGSVLGPPSDIYSLGVVLYEMICGRGPFDDMGDAYAIGSAHAQREPPPLSRFVTIAPEVERLVLASLAKDPAARPRDCFTFASELRKYLRIEEAEPRESTAVAMMSGAAPATAQIEAASTAAPPKHGAREDRERPSGPPDPFTRTEASPGEGSAPEGRPRTPIPAAGVPASAAAGTMRDAPPATPLMAGAPAHPDVKAPDVNGLPSTELAPGVAEPGATVPPTLAVGLPNDVDRSAPTRASAPRTQRLELEADAARGDARPATARLGIPARAADRLRDPHPSFPPANADSDELVFGPMQNPTGPMSGEARTRPPERSPYFPLVIAGVASVGMIGTALLFVVKPWTFFGYGKEAASAPLSAEPATSAARPSVPTASTTTLASANAPASATAGAAALSASTSPSSRLPAPTSSAAVSKRHASPDSGPRPPSTGSARRGKPEDVPFE